MRMMKNRFRRQRSTPPPGGRRLHLRILYPPALTGTSPGKEYFKTNRRPPSCEAERRHDETIHNILSKTLFFIQRQKRFR